MLGVLAASATLGATDAPRSSSELPADTVLLLVAPWCAPCWEELKRLDGLAIAAAPLRVRVLMMEDGARARAMAAEIAPVWQWTPRVGSRATVRAILWARTPALPFSVATDKNGMICAERGGGLDVGKARTLAQLCTSAPR